MQLGLLIANLELLRDKHGADLEVTGAIVDEGFLDQDDPDDIWAFTMMADDDLPVMLVRHADPDQCAFCGGDH